MARKYQLPPFLEGIQTQEVYERWLHRRAQAHVKRDRKRGNRNAKNAQYKIAIHHAVLASKGLDAYTLEELDWRLLGRYNNEEAKIQGRDYKKGFAMLPSVDHVGDGLGAPDFKICSWRTNDCKSDLSLDELVAFCRKVLRAHDSSS